MEFGSPVSRSAIRVCVYTSFCQIWEVREVGHTHGGTRLVGWQLSALVCVLSVLNERGLGGGSKVGGPREEKGGVCEANAIGGH